MLFKSLHHRLSACCIFCFFTCMPKRSSEGQKAWKLFENCQKKARTSVLLNHTKCAKLNRCTPLDRVMFNVCALLKNLLSWWTVWNVVLPGGRLLGKWWQASKLAVHFRTFFREEIFGTSAVTQELQVFSLLSISINHPRLSRYFDAEVKASGFE